MSNSENRTLSTTYRCRKYPVILIFFLFFPLLNLFFDRRTIHKMLKDNVPIITFRDSPFRESKFLTT